MTAHEKVLKAARESLSAAWISRRDKHGQMEHRSVVYHMEQDVIERLGFLLVAQRAEAIADARPEIEREARVKDAAD